MPQENYVLRCYSCETFQVHIVKKAKKWQCKICNEKQSFIRHYGIGDGKHCRTQVMKLNQFHREKQLELIEKECHELPENGEISTIKPGAVEQTKTKPSKWLQFLDEEDFLSEEESDEEVAKPNDEHCKNITKKRKLICENQDSQNETTSNKNLWEIPDTSNLIVNSNHNEESFFTDEIQTPNFEEVNSSSDIGQKLKKRKFSEYSNETTKKNKEESCTQINSVTNHGNIFSSDPNDLDDIMNINF